MEESHGGRVKSECEEQDLVSYCQPINQKVIGLQMDVQNQVLVAHLTD